MWTTNITEYGLVGEHVNGIDNYSIHNIMTGHFILMENDELYKYTISQLKKNGAVIFKNPDELPIPMTREEHKEYIKNLIDMEQKKLDSNKSTME